EFSLLILGINGIHFKIALIIGAFVHIDRLLIYLLLKKWDHDIPSTFHAYQLSRGKNIRRNKLFNG
ncbi:MAG: CDP-alcohol phosphatidyltransferase family protein, partial [Bacteroidota bacterium]